jgi:hypothetical protein
VISLAGFAATSGLAPSPQVAQTSELNSSAPFAAIDDFAAIFLDAHSPQSDASCEITGSAHLQASELVCSVKWQRPQRIELVELSRKGFEAVIKLQ